MKIARFSDASGRVQYGLVHGEHIHPIEETPAAAGDDWLALGCAAIDAIAQLAPPTRMIPIAAVKLLTPIVRPLKFEPGDILATGTPGSSVSPVGLV
jgi:uncharacterized protein DUF2437